VTEREIDEWFTTYIAEFAALGRGDIDDERRILAYYGAPMLLSSDTATLVLADEEQVLDMARRQITALRAAGYARTEVLFSETTLLNSTCALHRGRFARYSRDGSEITRLQATYVITSGQVGPHITTLALHTAT
jgi:hypothetical protein